jgi:hypothetical protein
MQSLGVPPPLCCGPLSLSLSFMFIQGDTSTRCCCTRQIQGESTSRAICGQSRRYHACQSFGGVFSCQVLLSMPWLVPRCLSAHQRLGRDCEGGKDSACKVYQQTMSTHLAQDFVFGHRFRTEVNSSTPDAAFKERDVVLWP